MADYGVSATTLSDPQGQGTSPVAPVEQQVTHIAPLPLIGELGNIFINGIKNNAKAEAEARKNAVIGEYVNNEKTYGEALTSGQWNASHVGAASRANYNKFLSGYPEYMDELVKAKAAVYGGTEVGEAQKQVDEEKKLVEKDKADASARGYVFYNNQSPASVAATLDAYKAAVRMQDQFQRDTAAASEVRAQNTDQRATESHQFTLADRVTKENARKGAVEIADKNFDAITTSGTDLFNKVQSGTISSEEALYTHSANISRIKVVLASVTSTNPELATPWNTLFGEMDDNIKARLDPSKKSTSDLQLLKDRYDTLVVKQKLLAIESSPQLKKAIVAAQLFNNDVMVNLMSQEPIKNWLYAATGTDPSLGPPPQMVGKKDDAQLFDAAKKAIRNLQSGGIPADKKPQAEKEALNTVNALLKDTASVDGSLSAAALKQASGFFSSPEFGRMAVEGKIDKTTASNAQHVFQVQYEPAVKRSINDKLEKEITPGEPLSRNVEIKMVGNNVVFEPNITKRNPNAIAERVGRGMGTQGMAPNAARESGAADMRDAAAGLNQLIRLHAHLEGTTDYAKYWEANKHLLMPNIFPDPTKLKPGQNVDGHIYNGGNYRDANNWSTAPAGK